MNKGRPTQLKREREKAKRERQQKKMARRADAKARREATPRGSVDREIAAIRPGLQPPAQED